MLPSSTLYRHATAGTLPGIASGIDILQDKNFIGILKFSLERVCITPRRGSGFLRIGLRSSSADTVQLLRGFDCGST